MKTRHYLILIAMALITSACERTLDFVNTQEEQDNDMTLDAIVVEGEPLAVYLSQALPVGKSTGSSYYDYNKRSFVRGGFLMDYQSNENYQKNKLSTAKVFATLNGQEQHELMWSYEMNCFVSDFVLKPQDRIEVLASTGTPNYDPNETGLVGLGYGPYKEVRAETILPTKPKIEILNYELIDENPNKYQGTLIFDTDTIMRLTCRISDTGGEKYYRLRVRSERCIVTKKPASLYFEDGEWKQKASHYYIMQDIFFSSDDLFTDSRLTSNFGGWPAFFSNVFDNSLMQGRDYTFTVDSPLVPDHATGGINTSEQKDGLPEQYTPPRVMVELQAISREMYLYLKSLQLYQVSSNDIYAEPMQIYSNVQNGWGIFCALSYDRHFVEYGE